MTSVDGGQPQDNVDHRVRLLSAKDGPTPFQVVIPQEAIDDLHRRLRSARLAYDFANEGWKYGTNGAYLAELVDYWLNEYDWQQAERAINSFSQFQTVLDEVPVHFIHERGVGPHPIPIVLSHGWPWTFWDFEHLIRPLTDPAAFGGDASDSFDVVVPSLPGFGFSSPLTRTGLNPWTTGDLWVRLMQDVLGYESFAAHGGDFGAIITAYLGHAYADHLVGIHLSLCTMLAPGYLGSAFGDVRPEDYGPDEQHYRSLMASRMASAQVHLAVGANDPQTLAYALNDSPVGLLAWLVERRRAWSDNDGNIESAFSKDFLLTNASIYWFTQTIGTSMRYYAERTPFVPVHDRLPAIEAPTAVALFPGDVILLPQAFARRHSNLARWTVMPSGGHFAAAERPSELVNDIREFFRAMR